MSLVKACHAGTLADIYLFLKEGHGITTSYNKGDWLDEGVYFWEDDPIRAENWQLQRNKGAILECEIDTSFLLNLLAENEHADDFYLQ